jgi:hypothetical protein
LKPNLNPHEVPQNGCNFFLPTQVATLLNIDEADEQTPDERRMEAMVKKIL